jgi:hypothetical protein
MDKIVVSGQKGLAKTPLRLRWEAVPPVGKAFAFVVSAGIIVAGFTWASSQFFQIRGVQHMLTSRIFLGLTVLFALLGVWGIAWVFFYSKRYYIIAAALVLLIVAGWALDRAFPMPAPSSPANPPASSPQIANMSGLDPLVVLGTYKIGRNWGVSDDCKNTSLTVTAEHASCVQGLRVVDTARNVLKQPIVTPVIQDNFYQDFDKEIASIEPTRKNYTPGDSTLGTVFTPVIDKNLDRAFRKGDKTILFMGKYKWTDAGGSHSSEACLWLQLNPQMFSGPGALTLGTQFIWQYCAHHNGPESALGKEKH